MNKRIEKFCALSACIAALAGHGAATWAATAVVTTVAIDTTNIVTPGDGAATLTEANDNSAYGNLALSSLTSGDHNSAFGGNALGLVSTASNNSAFGAFALAASTASGNSAFGSTALNLNSTGQFNNAFGAGALAANLTGSSNSAFGSEVLGISTASYNSGFGDQALWSNTTGEDNVAVGAQALFSNSTGELNNAVGDRALRSNTSGSYNVAMGHQALEANTTARNNVAIGVISLALNTTGARNTAVGFSSLGASTTANYNVGVGYQAGTFITTGINNIVVGANAGTKITTGSNNIHIGNVGAAGDSAVIRFGRPGTQKKIFVAGIRGTTVSGATVVVSATGQLGVQSSSRRYKQDIVDMGAASDALLKLRPVTFRYKEADDKGEQPLQYGLIAEEVAEVMPELVVRDEQGQAETVAYQTLSSLLLNEYQKQHRDMQALAVAAREQVARLEEKLASRDREMVAMQAQVARLSELTRQLQAALPAATPLATREP